LAPFDVFINTTLKQITMTGDGNSFDAKKARLNHPSGWLELTRYQTVRFLIDTLLESSPGHKFNKSELERRTGMSRESIREHISRLVELGVIEEINDSGWPEYQLNEDGKVTKELLELNTAVNSVLAGESKNVQVETNQKTEIPESTQPEIDIGRDTLLEYDKRDDPPDNSDGGMLDGELVDEPPEPTGA
jgi:DNA-binding transcriptional ArsR family regulator